MTRPTTLPNSTMPIIALVGRVNVGKSTLFNTLIQEKKAITSTIAGTTRTSNEGIVRWRGKEFRLIDTGGLTFEEHVPLEKDILKQSEKAMKLSDIVLFITDAKIGVLPQERELAKRMRRMSTKPVILVANKADNKHIEASLNDPQWYKLGLGAPFALSAASGRNVGDFLDHLLVILDKEKKEAVLPKETTESPIQISIIGKPNVGKSSLFNAIIGEERVIVNDMPHTTREPYDTEIVYSHDEGETKKQQAMVFVDTAGVRRKAKVSGILEREGIHKTILSLERSDLILFVIDGTEVISSQDLQLGGLIENKAKSVIILINKWDLAEDTTDAYRQLAKKRMISYFPHLHFAPILFVSGKTGFRVHQIFPTIMHVWQSRHTTIPDRALDVFIKNATKEHRPARGKGTRHPYIMGLRQIANAPPVFEMTIKYRTSIHRSYVNYIENKLREQFDFFGTPLIIKLKKQKKI